MAATMVDTTMIVFLAFGTWRGFRRGLIRELFSVFGALFAVMIAFQRYQELSLYLMENYSLADWQSQVIAFIALVVGISLVAVFIGFVWSKVIRLTPFGVIDNIFGAGFGLVKILIIAIAVILILNSIGIPPVQETLTNSFVIRQVNLFLPQLNLWLYQFWPESWGIPNWLPSDLLFENPPV